MHCDVATCLRLYQSICSHRYSVLAEIVEIKYILSFLLEKPLMQ